MSKQRILVADNQMVSLSRIYIGLLLKNFEVEATKSSGEIIQRIRRFHPHVIVVNADMPALDAPELCRTVSELNCKLIVLTERPVTGPVTVGNCTVHEVVHKPVDIESLSRMIHKILG